MASPTQLAILLYDVLKVPVVDKKKPRGTGEDILLKIDLPLCKLILEYRGLMKLVNTYIEKLPECISERDGRLHASFNQYGAATGRFSSSDPNLQNIPSHENSIRMLFTASPGYDEEIEIEDSITLNKYDYINTDMGFVKAVDLSTDNSIEIEENGSFSYIAPKFIKYNNNSVIIYF